MRNIDPFTSIPKFLYSWLETIVYITATTEQQDLKDIWNEDIKVKFLNISF